MAEYIEKEKVTKICLKHYNDSFTDIPAHEAMYAVSTDIENLPAADVVEVVHGEWIEEIIPLDWCEDDVDIAYKCSVCDCRNFGESPYCPNCGAKMDGERRGD